MSPAAIGQVVKRRAEQADFDPEAFGEGGQRGIALPELMELSGHRTAQVAGRYHRAGKALSNQAARLAG